MENKIWDIIEECRVGKITTNEATDKVLILYNVIDSNFKKTLVCKDGGTWKLSAKDIVIWESDNSIKEGDVLYKTVIDKVY